METTADEGQGGGPRLHHHRLQQATSSGLAANGVGASSGSASSSAATASGSSSLLRPHKRKLSSHAHEDFAAAAVASSHATSSTAATAAEVEASVSEAYRRTSAHGDADMQAELAKASSGFRSSAHGDALMQDLEGEASVDSSAAGYEAGGAASDDGGAVILDDRDPRSSEGVCIRRLQGCTPSSVSVGRIDPIRNDAPRSPTALQFPPVEETAATAASSASTPNGSTVSAGSSTGARSTAGFPSYFFTATTHTAAPSTPPTSHSAGASRPTSPMAPLLEVHVEVADAISLASSSAPSFIDETSNAKAASGLAHGVSTRPSAPATASSSRMRLTAPFKSQKRRLSSAKAGARRPLARRADEAAGSSSAATSGMITRFTELHKSGSPSMRRCSLGDAAGQSRPANCSGLAAPSPREVGVPSNFLLQPAPPGKRRRTALAAAQAAANLGPAATTASAESAEAVASQPLHASSAERRSIGDAAVSENAELTSRVSQVKEQDVELSERPLAAPGRLTAQSSSQRSPASALFTTSVDSIPTSTVAGSRFLLPMAPVTEQCRSPLARAPVQAQHTAKPSVPLGSARADQMTPTSSSSSKRNLPHLIAQGFHKKRYPRLRRTQSLPNLKARPLTDLAAPVVHRLTLPPHLAQYLASITRAQERGAEASSSSRNGASSVRAIFTPALHPPITRHTLRELDLAEILKNPQLRHDVVFDPNVQFRPNFDGERGRRKREAGDKYWTAVLREIERGCTCTSFDGRTPLPCTCPPEHSVASIDGAASGRKLPVPATPSRAAGSRIPSRIPHLIQELRTICLSILPTSASGETLGTPGNPAQAPPSPAARAAAEKQSEASAKAARTSEAKSATGTASISAHLSSPSWMSSHHTLILQTLDPHLITQELAHGVLDVCALITFLGSVLKLHCAPMRDEAIERMVATVVEDHDVGRGLRMCFEILELMKLDIANHQLRTARPYLVDSAVEFETRWFREQIDQGKMSLERTTNWFTSALSAMSGASSQLSRTEQISRAFNDGLLKLIFEAPSPLPFAHPSTPTSPAAALGAGVALSSSSLNHAYVTFFPETFQFDAYRLITFHADATDITVMHMLLLLFRQLACSPLLAGDAAPTSLAPTQVASNAATLAARHVDSVKEEIWCLLCDANLAVCSAPAPSRPGETPRTPRTPRTPSTPSSRAAALVIGGATGSAKLEDPRWRTAMGDVLLQIAARAGAIHVAARDPACLSAAMSASMPQVTGAPPSESMLAMLSSWLDNHLRTGSALHKMCQGRLRTVVSAMLVDRLGSPSRSTRRSPRLQAMPLAPSAPGLLGKRAECDDASAPEGDKKRLRLENNTISRTNSTSPASLDTPAAHSSPLSARSIRPVGHPSTTAAAPTTPSAELDWEAALVQFGLQPLGAEVRLLGERVAKVASFHLRVMRSLYEKVALSSHNP